MAESILLEICVETIDDLHAAIEGGADRIELCSALAVGGLTPSAGLAAEAVRAARARGLAVRAMVRPRDGDFDYAQADLAVAEAEGAALLAQGVDGLVFGMGRDGMLDRAAMARWVQAMRAIRPDAGLTLHRAIDLADDPLAGVDLAADLGFDCILSSGGAIRASDGLGVLKAMRARAGNRLTIMPGSGIRAGNVAHVIAETGARAVHASAAETDGQSPDPRVIALGFANGPRRRTAREEVRALRRALDALAVG
ncbi:copper homeostasis protein [Novosphingobium sp. CF614]|uniref:copper homeostasis protein CutC n=1 Tax=Novosphingobium sp. CF614 TaxID=1884364 RepID=UPI0008E66EF5|nr:copper homeostasis protein CutC [Novosphingobium sp. CF614]SFF73055.1 copper homeostasis protein [Novosphingobium sp. CF614]